MSVINGKVAFATFLALGTLALGIAFSGCNKEEARDTVGAYVPLFSATIDGKTWLGTATWRMFRIPLVGPQTVITAIGADGASGSSIVIAVYTNKTGDYTIGAVATGNTASYLEGQKKYDSVNGAITFTSFDTVAKRISGTFRIEVKNADGAIKSIANGKFENLPQQL